MSPLNKFHKEDYESSYIGEKEPWELNDKNNCKLFRKISDRNEEKEFK